MDPPQNYENRKRERQERLTAKNNSVDETYIQSMQWQDLIRGESDRSDKQEFSSVETEDGRTRYKPDKRKRIAPPEQRFFVSHDPSENDSEGERDSSENGSEKDPKTGRHPVPKLSPELRKLILIIRLAAASMMFAAAILFGSLSGFSVPLLILAACISGYDLAADGVKHLFSGLFYEPSIIAVLVTVGTAAAGFLQEAAAFLILYRITGLLTGSLKEIVSHSAIRQVSVRETVIRDLLSERFSEEGVDYISVEGVMRRTAATVLIPVILFAVLYAVFLPVFSYYRVGIAIHRALVLIALATPASLIIAMPVVGRNGLCAAASLGLVFKDARTLESLENTRTVVFDKSGIFDPPQAEVLSAHSERFDHDTLMNLVYHLVFTSEQGFAETIRRSVSFSYDPELVSGFEEAAGGVKGEINGTELLFGTRSFLSSYDLFPPETERQGTVFYYLFLAGQYAGEVCLSSDDYGDISDILHELRIDGVNKCILITGESAEEIARFAELNGFDEVYAGIAPEDKDGLLRELFTGNQINSILITSDPSLSDYPGAAVILAGEEFQNADAVLQPHLFNGLSGVLMVSKRIRQLAAENAMTAFVVKGILIFLSIIGYCNLWMAVLGETAAVIFTVFNARRVASKSIIETFINR